QLDAIVTGAPMGEPSSPSATKRAPPLSSHASPPRCPNLLATPSPESPTCWPCDITTCDGPIVARSSLTIRTPQLGSGLGSLLFIVATNPRDPSTATPVSMASPMGSVSGIASPGASTHVVHGGPASNGEPPDPDESLVVVAVAPPAPRRLDRAPQ